MKKVSILILFGFLTNNILFGQINQKVLTIDSMINIYTHYYDFCGSVLIEKNGVIILSKGYGYANYGFDIRNNDLTKFQICSLGKELTQLLIYGLVKEGRVNLEDKLYKYLPEIGEDIGNRVKLKHLVIHQSGLPEHFFDPTNRKTKIDNIKSIKDEKLLFEPGTKENYCNFNYYILDIIIERIIGREPSLENQEKIYKPLGMSSTKVDNAETMLKNNAIPHYVNQINQGEVFHHVTPKSNHGALVMNVYDLNKWIKAWHFDKFNIGTANYENENTKIYGKAYGSFSLGWEANGKKRRYAEGDGMGEGFRSRYIFFPDDSLTIILLNNSYYFGIDYSGMPLFDNIVIKSAEIMLELNYTFPKLPVGQFLIDKIKKGYDVSKVKDEYLKLKNDKNKYGFDVKQLNRVGYYYMDNNNLKDAFEIFTLNLSEYPESWIANDGMGECYLRIGNREKAIECLKISLDENPNKYREERKMNDMRRNNLEILNIPLDKK